MKKSKEKMRKQLLGLTINSFFYIVAFIPKNVLILK